MIVVISDLHLTDGRANTTVKSGAFDVFIDRIASMVRRQHRAAEYVPADAVTPRTRVTDIDVILNGDILDFIRSRRWRRKRDHAIEPDEKGLDDTSELETARPWDDDPREFIPVLEDIWQRMKENNSEAFAKLKAFSDQPQSVGLPPGVSVRIHYFVGNHDWFLYMCSPTSQGMRAIRDDIIKTLGLSRETHRATWPFPHDPLSQLSRLRQLYAENAITGNPPKSLDFPVLRRMMTHRVLVRHGDIHDPMNYSGDRAKSSIGDAVVIEILNALQEDVCARLDGHVQDETFAFVKQHLGEIDNLRPYSALPSWLQSLVLTIRSSALMAHDARQVEEALDDSFRELASKFIANEFIRSYPGWKERLTATVPFSITRWLGTGLPQFQEFIMRLFMSGGVSSHQYRQGAYREWPLRAGDFDYVVYGHTHHYQVVPLDHVTPPPTSDPSGTPTPRAWYYLNSGTWRPVQEPCVMLEAQEEFVFYHRLTVLTFFTSDERPTHRFDGWTGVLADSAEFPIRRTGNDMYVLDGQLVSKQASERDRLSKELGQGVYRIRLFDRDSFKDDLLCERQPDENGKFRCGFFRHEFNEIGEGVHPEPLIEVYRGNVQIASVKIDWPRYSGRHADVGGIEI